MSLRFRTPGRRLVPSILVAGAAGTVALGLSTTGTVSAFAASITNSVNNASTGTLVLQEESSDGSVTCTSTDDNSTNAATCSTINKYGGATLAPSGTSTTTVTMSNIGTDTPKTFQLAAGECSQSGDGVDGVAAATDLCTKVHLTVYAAASATGTTVYDGTLDGFTSAPADLDVLGAGDEQAYTFEVSVPADLGNGYQGLTVSQPLTWTMSS